MYFKYKENKLDYLVNLIWYHKQWSGYIYKVLKIVTVNIKDKKYFK